MITVLHGDHVDASRTALVKLRESHANKEIRTIDGSKVDEGMLRQALESQSLFGGDTCVVIERLFAANASKRKILKAYSEILSSAADIDIILWEGKELTTAQQKMLSGADIQLFKTPTVIFTFLDNLRPGDAGALLSSYETACDKDAPELIHAMLLRRVRDLMMVADGGTPARTQPWQVKRLTTQARFFTMEQLRIMYTQLLDIESSVKRGEAARDLRAQTTLLLVHIGKGHI